MLSVRVIDDPADLGRAAAEIVLATDGLQVLGVATGDSPLPVYAALAERRSEVSTVSAFALDEYVGLDPEHPASYHSVIARTVAGPLGLDPRRVHVPNGIGGDLSSAAERYEAALTDAGGVDIQVLGIGRNGHIGFNEPGSSVASRTRVVVLAEETRRANARFFPTLRDVPRYAVTQGISTILRARRILLIARGAAKADPIARLLQAPADPSFPASALHAHADVTVLLDADAAAGLAREPQDLLPRSVAWTSGAGASSRS